MFKDYVTSLDENKRNFKSAEKHLRKHKDNLPTVPTGYHDATI